MFGGSVETLNDLCIRARHALRVELHSPRVPRLRQGANTKEKDGFYKPIIEKTLNISDFEKMEWTFRI